MKPFLEIFTPRKSRIKETSKQKEKIVVDYRERNSLVYSELIGEGFEIEFKELKVADYIVKDVAIERKTVNDFVSSMISKRLMSQLQDLQQYKNRLLIVEGIDEQDLYTDSEEWTGMHPNAIRGFLLSILLRYKVPIIFTKNYKDTAKFISVLSRRKEKELSLNVSKKALNKKEQLQFIIEGFSGIGPKTSKKLLEKFKSIKNIMSATQEELTEVLGKKAEIFFQIINQNY